MEKTVDLSDLKRSVEILKRYLEEQGEPEGGFDAVVVTSEGNLVDVVFTMVDDLRRSLLDKATPPLLEELARVTSLRDEKGCGLVMLAMDSAANYIVGRVCVEPILMNSKGGSA